MWNLLPSSHVLKLSPKSKPPDAHPRPQSPALRGLQMEWNMRTNIQLYYGRASVADRMHDAGAVLLACGICAVPLLLFLVA